MGEARALFCRKLVEAQEAREQGIRNKYKPSIYNEGAQMFEKRLRMLTLVSVGVVVDWPGRALALVNGADSGQVLVATGALVEWPNGALALVRRVDRQPVRLAGG
jgi:hypothetical protein